MSMPPLITFLSDYGLRDEFVGVCHVVIAGICPEARVIDLTHGIPRQDVTAGATILAQSMAFLPVGVHLAVVDPGVGGRRRAIALQTGEGHRLVGPDNGLLLPAAAAGGGVVAAVDIGRSRFGLQPLAATFHGRDLFAPVSAALACGTALAQVGEALDPAELVSLDLEPPRCEDSALITHVLYVDGYGNVALDAEPGDLVQACPNADGEVVVEPPAGGSHPVTYGRVFGDVAEGQPLLYTDASGRLALAVNHGDAAQRFGLRGGDELRILRL